MREIRSNGRGETSYGYDLDGRLHEQVTRTAGADWKTTFRYDDAGRPSRVDYADGSSTTTTYNSDSTVKTQTTRDGLTLTYTYDAANRPLSVVPSGSGGEHLAPLDGGNLTKWDELSRPTLQSRGDSRLVQVIVENFAAPGIAGSRLHTYLRDELGTVIGVVGEEENNDPNSPNIPARYLYSPYGEAHIVKALEVREVRFEEADNELIEQVQEIEDPELQSEGALTVTFSAALDASSLWSGVAVERYDGEAWVAVPQQDLLLGYEDALDLKGLIGAGWLRGSSYRVRVVGVKDKQGRSLAKAEVFDWRIAGQGGRSDFSRRFKVEYESVKAAIDTLGGRFPGGQNHLFQGQGGVSDISQFSSWSRNPHVAVNFSNSWGPGGVVLRFSRDTPPTGAAWKWVDSPDEFAEAECLLEGIREGAEVFISKGN